MNQQIVSFSQSSDDHVWSVGDKFSMIVNRNNSSLKWNEKWDLEMANSQCEKLSPSELQQLQDFAAWIIMIIIVILCLKYHLKIFFD